MRTTKRTIIALDKDDAITIEFGDVSIVIEPNTDEGKPGLVVSSLRDKVFVTGIGGIVNHLDYGTIEPPVEDFETIYPDGASILITRR